MNRLPAFYKDNPALWFTQIEYAFKAAKIQDDRDMYYHFMANVDKQVLDLIPNIVSNTLKGYNCYGKICTVHYHNQCNCGPPDNYVGTFFSYADYCRPRNYSFRAIEPVYYTYKDIKSQIISMFDELGKEEFRKLFKGDSTSSATVDTKNKKKMILKFPKFYINNAETWFLQIEAIFSLAHVTTEREKCLQFMANLDSDILPLIRDMLPMKNYIDVKNRILTLSKTKKTTDTSDTMNDSAVIVTLKERIDELEKKIEYLTLSFNNSKYRELLLKISTNQEMKEPLNTVDIATNIMSEQYTSDLEINTTGCIDDNSSVKELVEMNNCGIDEFMEKIRVNPIEQNDFNTFVMYLSKHMIALEEYMKNTEKLKIQFDHLITSDEFLENRLATIIEGRNIKNHNTNVVYDSRLSLVEKEVKTLKATLEEFIETSKGNLNKLAKHIVVSIETYVAEMEGKIVKYICELQEKTITNPKVKMSEDDMTNKSEVI